MKHLNTHNLLIWIVFFYLPISYANEYVFEHITKKDKSNIKNIRSIQSDKQGYLWLAGDEGITRFDGNELIQIDDQPTRHLFISKQGDFWTTGTNTLSKINANTFTQRRYHFEPESRQSRTYHMLTTADGRQLFATAQGISEYHVQQDKFSHHPLVTSNNQQLPATYLVMTEKNSLLVGTTQGLFTVSMKQINAQPIALTKPLLANIRISQLLLTKDKQLLIGSNRGFYRLDKHYNILQHLPCVAAHACDNHQEITKLLIDKEKNIWIGTTNGLHIVDQQNNSVTTLKHDPKQASSLSNNYITDLHQDELGNIVVATYAGLDYFNRHTLRLKKNALPGQESLVINNAWSLAQQQTRLWVGTFGEGLYQISAKQQQHFSVNIHDKQQLAHNKIPTLFVDSQERLWLGTNNGLQQYNADQKNFINYPLNDQQSQTIHRQSIMAITEDNQQNLWLATTKTFTKISLKNKKIKIYNQNTIDNFHVKQWVRTIHSLNDGRILIGTDLGLHIFDPKTETINYLTQPNYVVQIMTDSRHDTWVLALDGLYLFDAKKQAVRLMPYFPLAPTGLDTGCNALTEDQHLQLWLICHNGVDVFDLSQRQFIKRFSPKNGANMNNFLTGTSSLVHLTSGEIAATMRDGIYHWPAEPQLKVSHPPIPKVTQVFYHYQQQAKANTPLFNFINTDHKSTAKQLSHHLQEIKFHFASLNQLNSTDIEFEYRLRGYRDTWTPAEQQNFNVTYTNLSANDYIFEVRAKYADSGWASDQFRFHIATKPWFTWWAYSTYLLLLLLLIAAIIRLRTQQLAAKKRMLEVIINQRTQELADSKAEVERLMQEKTQMIENIYHQTKTPLQLMLSNLTFLNEKDLSLVQYTDKQTHEIFKISRLTEQALKISKPNQQREEAPEQVCLTNLLQPLMLSYQDITQTKGLNFTWQISADLMPYCFPNKLEILVENLLSNAVKYSLQGLIDFSISKQTDYYIIRCQDSGIGIAANEQDNIVSRHRRATNTKNIQGEGIGLAVVQEVTQLHQGQLVIKSQLKQGSCFTISLPLQPPKIAEQWLDSANIITEQVVQLDEVTSKKDSELPLILIVEDNIELAAYLKTLLLKKYRIVNALSGEDGIQQAITWVPDLILCDIMMAKIDGFEVCQTVRNNALTNHIPILLVTAQSDSESRSKGFAAGANDFITKPFDHELLLHRINSQLEHVKNIRHATINAHKNIISPIADKLITRFLCFIEENYQDSELLIKDTCSALFVSARQLERKVRFFIDMTPNEYLNEYRLLRARELLHQGHKSNDVYSACGFSSAAYFSRKYKQRFAISPSQEKLKTP